MSYYNTGDGLQRHRVPKGEPRDLRRAGRWLLTEGVTSSETLLVVQFYGLEIGVSPSSSN